MRQHIHTQNVVTTDPPDNLLLPINGTVMLSGTFLIMVPRVGAVTLSIVVFALVTTAGATVVIFAFIITCSVIYNHV